MDDLSDEWDFTPEQLATQRDSELAAIFYDLIDLPLAVQPKLTRQVQAEIDRRGLSDDQVRAILPPFMYIDAGGANRTGCDARIRRERRQREAEAAARAWPSRPAVSCWYCQTNLKVVQRQPLAGSTAGFSAC